LVRLSRPKLGRPPKGGEVKGKQKQTKGELRADRDAIEGEFSEGKCKLLPGPIFKYAFKGTTIFLHEN